MKIEYREYEVADFDVCAQLVGRAWSMDAVLQSPELAALGKWIYTRGSLIDSNFNSVAICDDRVVGFLFGRNEYRLKPKGRYKVAVCFVWRLIRLRAEKKKQLISALSAHEKNRKPILGNKESEVVLFVIDEKFQRRGIGKALWARFQSHCVQSGVSEIFVEANRRDARGYYEGLGFTLVQNFDSPLHGIFSKEGTASICRWQAS